MASSTTPQIPLPPQTPSPPPDSLDQHSLAAEPQYDPKALSPMHGIMQNERLKGDMANMGPTSPTSPSFGSFSSHASNTNAGLDHNPFNFQPMALAKSPVMKSVWFAQLRLLKSQRLIHIWVEHRSTTWS